LIEKLADNPANFPINYVTRLPITLPDYPITRLPDYPITLPDYFTRLPDYQI